MEANPGRRDLEAWRESRPAAYYPERHLAALERRYLDDERRRAFAATAVEFGATVASIGDVVAGYEARTRLPELEAWDGVGNRADEIRFDGGYHDVGRMVWRTGVVALGGAPGASFEQAALLYLMSHEGEMGHACPVTCTVGLVRSLRRRATVDVKERFLPALLDTDYDTADRGAQFLTEVQGGSDVGANLAWAVPAEAGTYRIYGEKWFCSVADADQFLVTARPVGAPAGTAGLGCFVVPRQVDGALNGMRIRRLKEKLGTRAMASAEIDFEAAVAYPIGPLDEGFKTAVTAMLNTSRWLNAVGNCGMMRRAYLEAARYAVHRHAFGQPIADFPVVRAALAGMKLDWLAALHSTWMLTALDEAVDSGAASADDEGFHRFLVNANKYLVSIRSTAVAHVAIELLGGNGAIETFSVVPRLWRDSLVYEQWEGTHNVLIAQIRRDMSRLGLAGVVFERARRTVKSVRHPELSPAAATVGAALEELEARVQRSLEDPDHGAAHFRRHLGDLVRAIQAGALLEAADQEEDVPLAAELRDVADLFTRLHLQQGYRPDDDAQFAERVDLVVAPDLG